jgi:hypothetical protein
MRSRIKNALEKSLRERVMLHIIIGLTATEVADQVLSNVGVA